MVEKYKAYPEYKDSGVKWLGKIPSNWSVIPLKRYFSIINGSTPKSGNDNFWNGDIIWITPSDLSKLTSFDIINSTRKITKSGLASCGTSIVPINSIILSCRAPIGSIGLAKVELCTNQGCKSLVPFQDSSSYFYAYVLSICTEELNAKGKGTTFLELSNDELGYFSLPKPTIKEQRNIVIFLDYETYKIDTLIKQQQQLIKLLEEKRQAVISHTVTKGLNPNVSMKDSGVEWLGEIPEHWQIWKLAHAFEIIGSGTTPPSDTNDWYGDDINWVTTGELREDIILSTSKKIKKKTLQYFSTLKIYPKGTILIAMYGATIGRLGILGESATTNQACCALSNSNYLFNMYLFYWLISFRQEIIQLSSGGGQPNINQEKVAALKISTPTLEEQKEIISFLDQETLKLRHLIAKANKVIELLKERRTALISAAVTGKIDVRDWQAPTVMD